jgi:hypothetical protein
MAGATTSIPGYVREGNAASRDAAREVVPISEDRP